MLLYYSTPNKPPKKCFECELFLFVGVCRRLLKRQGLITSNVYSILFFGDLPDIKTLFFASFVQHVNWHSRNWKTEVIKVGNYLPAIISYGLFVL